MSLDVTLVDGGRDCVFDANITHNLGAMADAAGIYEALWRPDEHGITKAGQLVGPLRRGLAWLKANESDARKHDSPNGWGLYDNFVPWVERYLVACEAHPEAAVRVWR